MDLGLVATTSKEPGKGERRRGMERGGREGREEARGRGLTALAGAGGWLQGQGRWLTLLPFLGNRATKLGGILCLEDTKRYEACGRFSTPFGACDFGIGRGRRALVGGCAQKVIVFPRFNSMTSPNVSKRATNSR
jgi:hypothetical protein